MSGMHRPVSSRGMTPNFLLRGSFSNGFPSCYMDIRAIHDVHIHYFTFTSCFLQGMEVDRDLERAK